MKKFKKIIVVSLSFIMISVFSASAFAAESNRANYDKETIKMYSELYKQDQQMIAEINRKLPQMIKEGQEIAKYDVKAQQSNLEAFSSVRSRSSSLGTYGDILVSLIINSGSVGFAGHAAIVSSDSSITIESYAKSWSPINKDGVQYYNNTWNNKSGALLIRPKNATSSQYTKASSYASNQVGKPYNWDFTNKNTTSKFYCSQLVWKAWLSAGIDCEKGSIPNAIIAPADLVNSSNTYIVKQVK